MASMNERDVDGMTAEIQRDDGERIMAGPHMDHVNGCEQAMNDATNHSVTLTKRRRRPYSDDAKYETINADDDGDDHAEYAVEEQNGGKRRKIEVRKSNKSTGDENRPPKPPVPPKPKHLVCRPPAQLLSFIQTKTKLENEHAVALHKLTAHAEQLRQENRELRLALNAERNAVRTLR